MCYSAQVRQNLKHLSRRYEAEVDWAAFDELYRRRAEGKDIKASRDLQRNFQNPETDIERRIAVYIAHYLKTKRSEWESEVFVQRRRVAQAEESLAKRDMKKAREDIRIGTKKVQDYLDRLADLRRTEPNDEATRSPLSAVSMELRISMNEAEIRHAVHRAIDSLRGERPPLDFHSVHERSTAHRLALHLEPDFEGWNLDCEYDRLGTLQKLLDGIRACDARRATDRILPDIIVHHRTQHGTEHNLLVAEIKKSAERDDCDFMKLLLMTDPHGEFHYQLGLYINLNQGNFDCTWFKDGAVFV